MSDSPAILFDSFGGSSFASSWRFGGYVRTVVALHPGEVIEVLRQVEQAAADGLYAAGFVAYEAASALNPDLPSAPPVEGLPLAWFALFQERFSVEAGVGLSATSADVVLVPAKTLEEYIDDVERLREYVAAGDCYQVNHTFPMQGVYSGNLRELYQRIGIAQRAPFCAHLPLLNRFQPPYRDHYAKDLRSSGSRPSPSGCSATVR